MKIVSFSPFEQVDSLRQQIDRVFAEIDGNESHDHLWQPGSELIDHPDNLVLRISLAGVNKEAIEIQVSKKAVAISGERHRPPRESSRYIYSELNYGKFSRQISLPVPIINTQVKASYEAGMLTLILPKVEEAKQQVVKVNLENSTSVAESLPEIESTTDKVELASA